MAKARQADAVGRIVEVAGRISRPRALRILEHLIIGHEVMIRTHPEPAALRMMYLSGMAEKMLNDAPETFDPHGRIRWLRSAYTLLDELGIDLNNFRVDI